MIVLPKEAKLF